MFGIPQWPLPVPAPPLPLVLLRHPFEWLKSQDAGRTLLHWGREIGKNPTLARASSTWESLGGEELPQGSCRSPLTRGRAPRSSALHIF